MFPCALGPYACLPWRSICSDPLPSLKSGCLFKLLSCQCSWCVLDKNPFAKYVIYEYFSPSVGGLLTVSSEAREPNFDEVQFVFLCLLLVFFGVIREAASPNPRSRGLTPVFSPKSSMALALPSGSATLLGHFCVVA